MFIM